MAIHMFICSSIVLKLFWLIFVKTKNTADFLITASSVSIYHCKGSGSVARKKLALLLKLKAEYYTYKQEIA